MTSVDIRFRRIAASSVLALSAVCAAQPAPSPGPPVRGQPGDFWADVVIGQPDFNEVSPSNVSATTVFNPGGVIVDRSVRPNRIYVYDGGNDRVLGFSRIGYCKGGPDEGKPGTCDSDFPGHGIVPVDGIGANLVIGQPSFDRASANRHGNFDTYPDPPPASATSLQTMPVDQVSLTEGGSFANMALDDKGNLYVPDFGNHRVLRFDRPFETDGVADDVWGQPDFAGNQPNHGNGYGKPDASGLALRSPGNLGFVGGVGLDQAGNLWITDNENNRVLRFPFDSKTRTAAKTADLVLGQPDFTTCKRSKALNEMSAPCAVRVAPDGTVYIADSLNDRVLVFKPPLKSGMDASGTFGTDLKFPTSLEFDPQTGGLWVLETNHSQALLFIDGQVKKVLGSDVPRQSRKDVPVRGDRDDRPRWGGSTWFMTEPRGQIGIDSDGNVYLPCSTNVQNIWRFPTPLPDPQPGHVHSADIRLFRSSAEVGAFSESRLASARGVAVVGGQLIVADEWRVMFWNNVKSLANYDQASGTVGAKSLRGPVMTQPYGRLREDKAGHLWAVHGEVVEVYKLPLANADMPFMTLKSPLPVVGGGELKWGGGIAVGGVALTSNASHLWLSDPDANRAFRIRDPLTQPIVDVVLGHPNLEEQRPNNGGKIGRDTLNYPGAVVLDPHGNVFVSDHTLEVSGNHRLLEFDASLFPPHPEKCLFGLPASHVWGHGGKFDGNPDGKTNLSTFEPAFDAQDRMIVGCNGYSGRRFPLVFGDPFRNAEPIAVLRDFGSMPFAATFDEDGNFYITDLNRARVLIYRKPFGE